MTLVSKNHQYY